MNRDRASSEYEFQTPRVPLEVTLSIDPDQLEMAMLRMVARCVKL